jgi:hypothetical protein
LIAVRSGDELFVSVIAELDPAIGLAVRNMMDAPGKPAHDE